VLGPVPGVFGCLQALEALKTVLDLRGQLGDELLVLDLMTMSTSRVRIRRPESCPDHATARVLRTQPVRPIEVDSVDIADAQIIDIREPVELFEAPTPWDRARHIPMADLLHGAGGKELSPRGKYILVCASGRRSLAATEELRARGFDEVYSLRGGVNALARRPVT